MRQYLFIPKAGIVNKNEKIIELCRDKDILDIGLGGHMSDAGKTDDYLKTSLEKTLHGQLVKVAGTIDGLDINERMISVASAQFPGKYYLADLTDEQLSHRIDKRYDAIVLGDVIEHLDAFRPALQNLKKLLKPDGILIISTANAYCIDAIIKMLFRYESVHEEHTAYFSYKTMSRLLAMNGYAIRQFFYYTHNRKQFDSLPHYIGVKFKGLFTRIFPQYEMGILFVATPEPSHISPLPAKEKTEIPLNLH
jgi:2-polyprenyl-3-methyl-5-hydroxy-6-metoxy-1,4-benzoquinol methylase